MSLLIAMPAPQLPEIETAAPAGRTMPPVLPALSALLARARRLPAAPDWRAGVQQALGGFDGAAAIPAAALAAAALPELSGGLALCCVEPLHVVAGISRVHLPPGGRLQLDSAEAAAWADAFNREFGGPQLRLHAAGDGWLLVAPCAAAARDPAPEHLVGLPLARAPARDDAERALRRLGAETEIWLASQPLNRAREARQQAPINSLWFSGGAHTTQLPRFARPPRTVYMAGRADAWLAGLAAHCAAPLVKAVDWQASLAAGDALLVLPPASHGATAQYWQALETQWFTPAARALHAGALAALRLQIGGRAWQLPDRSLLRWLRRPRPWYEAVRA